MNKHKKILIAGGGLAGTFLSAELCLAGHSVTMLDEEDPKSASRTAAGLFNIVTGRHSNKTWMAEDLLERLLGFFGRPEFSGMAKHLFQKEIYRPFLDINEYNDWALEALQPDFEEVVRFEGKEKLSGQIVNPLGGISVLKCGWLETAAFLKDMKELLERDFDFEYFRGPWNYPSFDPVGLGPMAVGWGGQVFTDLIFAEGIRAMDNPWFGPLIELRPLKGQVLEVEIPGFCPDFVLNRKVFVIPRGEDRFTVGSTYERWFEHTEPTAQGIEEISGQLRELIKIPFSILEARSAVRPTTPNRRPILGTHPDFSTLHILNGMGTKGVLHAPWAASLMRRYLEGEIKAFDKEIGLKRFIKEFS